MQIILGAMADPLRDQLAQIALTPEQAAEIDRFDHDANAISRLYIRGFISDSQATQARQRLMRKIQKLIAG